MASSSLTQSTSPGAPDEPAGGDPLSPSRATFRLLVDLSSDLILLHRDGRAIYMNAAARRALSLPPGERTGPLTDFFHEEDRPVHARWLRGSSPPRGGLSLRWMCAGGTYRTTEATIANVDVDGVWGVMVVARDLTERAEFQHQLLQRDRMAAIGTLSAGVAHEINNPLTYLLVNIEHVLRRIRAATASDDPVAELESGALGLQGLAQSLQQASEGANRVRQIVRGLAMFAQGNFEHRSLVDVRGVLESATQMAWHEIRHRARLVKSLADVPLVDANEAHLGQVFVNLLVNAAQADPSRGTPTAEGGARRDADSTSGATRSSRSPTPVPGSLPRTSRACSTRSSRRRAAGRAWASRSRTARSRASAARSASRAPSRRARRSRWRSPRARPSATGGAPRRAMRPPAVRRRVLVIDDERLVGEAIARVLEEENDVDVVTEARDALTRLAAGQPYDVVLCDLMMPVMTGMDLYAEVVRGWPRLAGGIVFMTGGAFTARAHAFIESVSNPCLEKPIDTSRLRTLVAKVGAASPREISP